MSEIIYQDKYKVTIPKVVDYGCIFLAVFFKIFCINDNLPVKLLLCTYYGNIF